MSLYESHEEKLSYPAASPKSNDHPVESGLPGISPRECSGALMNVLFRPKGLSIVSSSRDS